MTAFLSAFQAELLLAACEAHEPLTVPALTSATMDAGRSERVRELARAGFLIPSRHGPHTRYRITPAGRELAEYLRRLEAARED